MGYKTKEISIKDTRSSNQFLVLIVFIHNFICILYIQVLKFTHYFKCVYALLDVFLVMLMFNLVLWFLLSYHSKITLFKWIILVSGMQYRSNMEIKLFKLQITGQFVKYVKMDILVVPRHLDFILESTNHCVLPALVESRYLLIFFIR